MSEFIREVEGARMDDVLNLLHNSRKGTRSDRYTTSPVLVFILNYFVKKLVKHSLFDDNFHAIKQKKTETEKGKQKKGNNFYLKVDGSTFKKLFCKYSSCTNHNNNWQ